MTEKWFTTSNGVINMSVREFEVNKELDKDKRKDLTVKGARDLLSYLVEAGFGDYSLSIGYDSNYAYTGMNDENIEIVENPISKVVKLNEKDFW